MTESLNTVRGSVTKDGVITAGSGFRVTHDKTGIFNVLFDTGSFSDTPTVVASPISNSAKDDKTRMNCVVQRDDLGTSGFVLITGDDDGDLSDRDFGFIAMGPASV